LPNLYEDYDFLEPDDRYRLLIDLGKALEPMPEPLKTDATLVRGCSASVWVYPMRRDNGSLHFSPTAMPRSPRGSSRWSCAPSRIKAPPRSSRPILPAALAPFDLGKQLSSNRTQGIPNMIALIRETAARYA